MQGKKLGCVAQALCPTLPFPLNTPPPQIQGNKRTNTWLFSATSWARYEETVTFSPLEHLDMYSGTSSNLKIDLTTKSSLLLLHAVLWVTKVTGV